MEPLRFMLDQSEIPTHWYNVVADMPHPPAPALGPDNKPVPLEKMAAIFPMALLEQEMSSERWIPIPEPVREIYRLWRPTPLIRAKRLEEMLGTPAKIYYKNEGVSSAGSHKPNTAVAQAYYNREAGIRRLTTETGAGQWGSSIAFAGRVCIEGAFQVRSLSAKAFVPRDRTGVRKVIASPFESTQTGSDIYEIRKIRIGGIAISRRSKKRLRADTNMT